MTDPTQEVMQLRGQGLSDSVIMNELTQNGYTAEQVHTAIMQTDGGISAQAAAPPAMAPSAMAPPAMSVGPPSGSPMPNGMDGNIYERIEEIAESMIDQKWDQLVGEVKKIIEWKNTIEEKQTKMVSDVQKLREDFDVLHKAVLGKVEEYDARMRDVGTELNAVGKVFKDVIPQFVENVKELGHIKEGMKK